MTLVLMSDRSSALMPTTVTPLSRYFASIATNSGNSATHGPHQVAQKLITSTLPFSASFIALNSAGLSAQLFGATVAFLVFAGAGRFGGIFFCGTNEAARPNPGAKCRSRACPVVVPALFFRI